MVAYVRVVDGTLRKATLIVAMQAGTHAEIDEIGFFGPQMTRSTPCTRARSAT